MFASIWILLSTVVTGHQIYVNAPAAEVAFHTVCTTLVWVIGVSWIIAVRKHKKEMAILDERIRRFQEMDSDQAIARRRAVATGMLGQPGKRANHLRLM